MSIRPATEADISLILARVRELLHPPNMDEDGVRELLESDVVMVDDALKAICAWHRNDRLKLIYGRYLLGPRGVSLEDMKSLLAYTFDTIMKRWPDTAGWRLEAPVTRAMARYWGRQLRKVGQPGPHETVSEVSGKQCIWWTTQAVRDRTMGWVDGP